MASKPSFADKSSKFDPSKLYPRVKGVDPRTGRVLPLPDRPIPQFRSNTLSEKQRIRNAIRFYESEYAKLSAVPTPENLDRRSAILMYTINLIHDFFDDYATSLKSFRDLNDRLTEILEGAPMVGREIRSLTWAEWSYIGNSRRFRIGYQDTLRRLSLKIIRVRARPAARRATK